MKKLLLFAIVILGFSAASFGQLGKTATASASASIVTPINITKNVDLNFGNIAVNANQGTVELAATASAGRTATGGITLPDFNTGTPTAAKFTVTGADNYTYQFFIPESVTTVANGANTMTVDEWSHSSTGILSGGSEVVYVGATIHVAANQAPGSYTSAIPFTVRVDYE